MVGPSRYTAVLYRGAREGIRLALLHMTVSVRFRAIGLIWGI